MKFSIKNTKTPEQILKEKVINTQVVYIHTRKDKPGHVFYVGEGKPERPYSKKRNSYWNNIVKTHGYNVHIIKTNLTVEESVALEVKLTLAYKSIGMAEACLVIGGYGNKIYSEETKRKISLSNKNKIMSAESRQKMSIAKKGKIFSEQARFNMRLARQNMSPENKQKILNASKNRVISDETRLKISIAAKNISDETRLKLSIASKGRIMSEATKLKMSIAKKNISDETRQKMGDANRRRVVSDETKKKLSIARKNISSETRAKLSIAAKNKAKKVQAYIGDKIINNFNNVTEAASFIGVTRPNIHYCCNGTQQTSGIYDFETKKFVSLTRLELKEYPNCKRVSWRYI